MQSLGICLLAFASLVSAKTVWDGAYTEEQASRGAAAFGQNCAGCHTLATAGKSPLAGDPFWKSFQQKSVGDLLNYVSANMPNGRGGSLDKGTYRDIAAAMLKANGFPAGSAELVTDAEILPKDGNTELPADALVRVIGCLARSGSDWMVTNATNPERAEQPAPTESSGRRPMTLKFVVQKLDPLAGSRVAVTGLLIGAGGSDGINVTAVTRVAEKCP